MKTTYYKRPEILAKPQLEQGHAVIEASAGTGKTFTLEHLVLDLVINSEAKIEEILVVTFTEAATRELRERIRTLIRKVCNGEGEAGLPADPANYWEIDDAVRSRLLEALFRFDGAAISTIHGFCQRILSEQAFLGGRLFEQEHVEGTEMFGLAFREEVRLALAEEGPVGENLRLWIEQENTLEDLEKLLYRCHREGCPDRCPVTPLWDPQGMLEAAERLPAAEELKLAARELFTEKLTIGGFEKLLDRLFTVLAVINETENPQEAASLFTDWAKKECTINKAKKKQIDHLSAAAGRPGAPDVWKNLSAGLDEITKRAASVASFFAYELLPRVQLRLSARKLSLGLIDYDDMLLGVQETLQGSDSKTLLDTLRGRWTYALVDEFQDTDPVQWDIFKRIFVNGSGPHRLFIIGDPKQAIYSFRGADVHTYELAKENLVEKHGASRLPLVYNYRSTGTLIDAVNEILTVEDACENVFFDGLNHYDEPVKCGDKTRTADITGQPAAPVHLLHLHGKDEKLSARSVRRGVACFIAEEILRITSPDQALVTSGRDKDPAPIKLSDIYILTRSGKEGRDIGEVLRRYGVPHAFYKQEGLFKTAEAEDIHRLLRAIDSPAEPAERMAAWLTPFFGIALQDLPNWQYAGENYPLTTLLLRWKSLADMHAWSRLFDAILKESGLVRRLIFSGAERALTNYLHLFELLQAEAHSHPVTITELARGLKARIDGRKMPEGREGDVQRLETDKEAVQILTMHKAKGLEAEVVFIGGGFGNPPESNPKMNIYHVNNERRLHIGNATGQIVEAIAREINEENQRLMYVAITRAKSRLYLPYFGEAPEKIAVKDSYGYKNLGVFYRKLQKQLDLLRRQGRLGVKSRFVLRIASCEQRPPGEQEKELSLAGWPEEDLLEMPESSVEEAARIMPGRRGVLLTSYTRMSRGKIWQAPAADLDDQAARRDEEVSGEAMPEVEQAAGIAAENESGAPGETVTIPGGREAGIFLHALLESTPVEEINALSFEQWSALEQARKRAETIARGHSFSEIYIPQALKLAYAALRTPVSVQSREGKSILEMPGGFASGKRHCAEMSFVYPIPETFHPLLGQSGTRLENVDRLPFEALRGYLQGLIDLVFEKDEKIYMLDWKSDHLPSYEQEILDAHIDNNYKLQAQVYALAVTRLLGIKTEKEYERSFGGILYVFIRGIQSSCTGHNSKGIWYSRPFWNEITAWEQGLLTRRDWGDQVIEQVIR